jgi:hypothetical protein
MTWTTGSCGFCADETGRRRSGARGRPRKRVRSAEGAGYGLGGWVKIFASGFAPRRAAAERTLERLPNYRSYLACGSDHCALPTPEFSSLRVGGVRLRDWVADLAAGRNVGCPTCRG